MNILLDINSDLYELPLGSHFKLVLESKGIENALYNPEQIRSLCESRQIEYAMSGTVFRFAEVKDNNSLMTLFASFGGLILELTGEVEALAAFNLSDKVYLYLARASV